MWPDTRFYALALLAVLALWAPTALLAAWRGADARTLGAHERALDRTYLGGYLLCISADWLQGPHVYALYDAYGYDARAIAVLFTTGFVSAMAFGPFVGDLADRFGRRWSCVVLYCGSYAVAGATKHFSAYALLVVGRLAGGIATTALFSSFEAWLVCEHRCRALSAGALEVTLGRASLGSGVVAILSGLAAQAVTDAAPMVGAGVVHAGGYVSAFDLSILMCVVGATFVQCAWCENTASDGTGRAADARAAMSRWRAPLEHIGAAAALVRADATLGLLMAIACAVDVAMYAFIFAWTPALSAGGRSPPHGLVFSALMAAFMTGAAAYPTLLPPAISPYTRSPPPLPSPPLRSPPAAAPLHPPALLVRLIALTAVAATTLSAVAVLHATRAAATGAGTAACFALFLLFELSLGIYVPQMAALKARSSSAPPRPTRSRVHAPSPPPLDPAPPHGAIRRATSPRSLAPLRTLSSACRPTSSSLSSSCSRCRCPPPSPCAHHMR